MLIALALVAAIASGSEGLGDPDGVVTTAPRGADSVLVGAVAPTAEVSADVRQAEVTAHNLTTQQQIDRWLTARSAETLPFEEAAEPGDDRQMHGYVSGSIGTDDYSNVSVGVSLPVGENGRIDLEYSQTKNGYGYGYGYPGYGYGYDYPGNYGYGLDGRRDAFGAYDPFRGAGSQSGRAASLRFRWDEDKDRDDRSLPRRGRMTAAD